MPISDSNDNLLKKNFIATRDGVFDDFFDSTKTNNIFTDNSNNIGSSFSQNVGEIIIDDHATLTTTAQKYYNNVVLTPTKGLPFPWYVDLILETRIKLVDANVTFAGIGLSYGDLNLGTANQRLMAGIFYESGGASTGVRLYKGSLTATDTSHTISLGTEYTLTIQLKYNFESTSNNTNIYVTVWVDGTKVVDSSSVTRSSLLGYRVDGLVSLATIIPPATSSGGGVRWYYFCCNRMENLLFLQYRLSTLYKIPELEAKILNVSSESSMQLNRNSLITVYARNSPLILPFTGLSLATNLIMRLDMNYNVNDASGNGYDGTLQDNATVGTLLHGYRYVLDLDGSGDYVDLPDINIDWATAGFTIAFWIIMDTIPTFGADRIIYDVGTTSSSSIDRIMLLHNIATPGSIRFLVRNSANDTWLLSIVVNSIFTANVPVHVIVTVDSAYNIIIYKNNVSAGTATGTGMPATVNRTFHGIGDNILFPSADSGIDGQIWDFVVWNRVISSDERTDIYDGIQFKTRWTGFINSVKTNKENIYAGTNILAYHYSQLLEKRLFQGSFTSQTSDYIISDATNGIMTKATEFTTTNVQSGNASLTKKYNQETLRNIILRLATEEDFSVWIDPDLNLHFEPIGFTDSGRSFVEGDSFLIDYYFDDLSSQDYNVFEVHATGVWARYETTGAVEQQGNERVKRIIDTTITTQAEAERVAREAALKSLPIQTGRLMIQADYSLSIGDVISLTLSGTNFVVSDKKYIITEIIENPFSKIQELLITENISEAADYLYSIYETSKNPETSDLDTDATKTYTIAFDINVDVWCDYLIETHNGSVWSTHDSGKATVLNRAMAILTACLGNITRSALINVEEGDFSAGLKFQLGTGTNKPNITDQTLESKISGSDKSSTIPATRTLTDIPNIKTTVTWDTTLVNGNSITEAGYYVDRTGGRGTDYLYGTVAIFSPYNDDTDLLVKCVFPAFSKDNTNQIRVTFTWYLESSSKSRINKA